MVNFFLSYYLCRYIYVVGFDVGVQRPTVVRVGGIREAKHPHGATARDVVYELLQCAPQLERDGQNHFTCSGLLLPRGDHKSLLLVGVP